MRIHHEEAFGPVVTVLSVADDEEAVTLANDTDYGLTAGVLTGDTARGWGVDAFTTTRWLTVATAPARYPF